MMSSIFVKLALAAHTTDEYEDGETSVTAYEAKSTRNLVRYHFLKNIMLQYMKEV